MWYDKKIKYSETKYEDFFDWCYDYCNGSKLTAPKTLVEFSLYQSGGLCHCCDRS